MNLQREVSFLIISNSSVTIQGNDMLRRVRIEWLVVSRNIILFIPMNGHILYTVYIVYIVIESDLLHIIASILTLAIYHILVCEVIIIICIV